MIKIYHKKIYHKNEKFIIKIYHKKFIIKMIKNAFYFVLKALLVLKMFKIFS